MTPLSRIASVATAAVTLALVTACADNSPTAPAAASSSSVLAPRLATTTEAFETGRWSRIVRGETGPGSEYAIYVPREWNGDLVTIAHGFRADITPVTNNTEPYMGALREALGDSGFAVAYSSYSENGFAVKDGAQRTHQLRGLAAAQLGGQPNRSFLVGFSLGGAIALSLAEEFPAQYDGALLACGMVGGSLPQTQYLGHVRVLFDAAFPNVLPGNVLEVPPGLPSQAAIQGAALSNLPRLFAIASTQQTPLPWVPGANAVPTMIGSLITALSFHSLGIANITDLVNGKSPFGNDDVTYTLGTPAILPGAALEPIIGALNAGAGRYTMAPAARQYLAHNYTPSGALATKVVTIHNRWDSTVPLFHEDSLAAAVARTGSSANLSQRIVNAYGHCTFDVTTLQIAFGDLERWNRTGVKP